MVIENGVVVEVGALVEAKRIGEGSVIEINARIGKGAVIGKVGTMALSWEWLMLICENSTARSVLCAKWRREMWFRTLRWCTATGFAG